MIMKNISRKLDKIIKLYEELYDDEQFKQVKAPLIKAISLTRNVQLFVKEKIKEEKKKMKNGIYLKSMTVEGEIFWYVFGHSNGRIKFLHKDGTWNESCYDPLRDKEAELYSGHYATREEAIEAIKKYTRFVMIYDNEEKEVLL